jgi:hypothetical protein
MLHPDGFEVYIKCLDRDEIYTEYTKPGDNEIPDSKIIEKYIEVSSGERYAIVVAIKGHYDFQDAEGISISTLIDDGVMNQWR